MPDWNDVARFIDRSPMLFRDRRTACAVCSSDGRVQLVNRAFLDLLGVQGVEQLQQSDVAQAVGIDTFLRSMSFTSASYGVDGYSLEGKLLPLMSTDQRGVCAVLIAFRPAKIDGLLVGVLLEVENLSEFTRLKNEIRDRSRCEQILRTLFDSFPEPVTSVDLDARYVRINSATERLYGYTIDELVGEPMSKVFPGHRNAIDKILDQVMKSITVRYEATAVRKDAAHIRVEVFVVPQIVNDVVVGMYEFPRLK